MSELKKESTRNNLIQNIKMADEFLKKTKKSLTNVMIDQDMLKKVNELKKTVDELTEVARESNRREDNAHDNEEENIQATRKQQVVECNKCERKFENVSNLENHIKIYHKDSKLHECNHCHKCFVTTWRLKKHMQMHSGVRIKPCNYYTNGIFCPFEELGCKFGHTEGLTKNTELYISKNIIEDENYSFSTSTPKKSDKLGHTSYRQDKKRKRLECYKTIGQSKDLEEALDKVNDLIENKKFLESKLTQMMKMITDMEEERNF